MFGRDNNLGAHPGFFSLLWRVAILGVCSILIVSIATGLLFAIEAMLLGDTDVARWSDYFWLGFIASLSIGGIAGLLYGVPVYTLYRTTIAFPLWALLVLTVAPGIWLLFIEVGLGVMLIAGGVAFLVLLHELAIRWLPALSPNDMTQN